MRESVLIATPVLLIGGTEFQVLGLVDVLLAAGYKVRVCCYYEFDQSVVELFQKVGAEIILLELNRSGGRFGPSKIIELIRKLSKTFQRYHPDLVHVQYLAPGLIPIIASKLAGQKTVFATVHIAGSFAYGWKAKILLRIASTLCTAFFCVSRGVEEFWFGDSEVFDPKSINPSRKHFTIYNAIDVGRISEIVREGDSEAVKQQLGISGRPVIGIVGRLAKQKGHTILLDAMVEVVKEIPNVVLVVIGDGPEGGSLKLKAQYLGIEKNILWLGMMKQEEVFKLYGVMDVFAMPSLYEGFGLTAAEAMAAGLPVVGTRIEGLSEIIEDDVTGCFVPANNSEKLAQMVIRLLKNHEIAREMGLRGYTRVKELFSMEHYANALLLAYEYFSNH